MFLFYSFFSRKIGHSMWLHELLGIRYPLIQGGMAWISDASLASAVSEAGGLGVIAAGNAPAEWLRQEIEKVRKCTDAPFGVNVMLLSPHVEAVVEETLRQKVPVVITGAGNPGKYIPKWQENGSKVIPVVPSLALAKRMERAGADAVIAEGMEAGGHIGKLATTVLTANIAPQIGIPLVCAGGIWDWRGVAMAVMLGAKGVQVGTRFVMAKECTVNENYKERMANAKDVDSVVTGEMTGHPVRVLRNRLTRELDELGNGPQALEKFEEATVGALRKAVVEGDMEYGSVMAGQCAAMAQCEESVEEIIRSLFDRKAVEARVAEMMEIPWMI
jgi:enoyl-[acyl-carrier protein] reductase II